MGGRANGEIVGLLGAALLASCSLVTSTAGLSGGAVPDASTADGDATSGDAATTDASDSGFDSSDAATTYRDLVLSDGPVGYWRLGEATGITIADESGHGREATLAGGVSLGQPGAIADDPSTAAAFNGTNAYASIGQNFDFVGNAPFSVEAWIKPTLYDSIVRHFITKQDRPPVTKVGYAILVNAAEGLKFERYVTNSGLEALAPAPPLNVYAHVVGTYDGASLRLYVNGVLAAGPTPDPRVSTATAAPALIGSERPGGGQHFAGSIDETAIYDRALTAAQILAHYKMGSGL